MGELANCGERCDDYLIKKEKFKKNSIPIRGMGGGMIEQAGKPIDKIKEYLPESR